MLPARERIETGAKPHSRASRWPNPRTAFLLIAGSLAFWVTMAGIVLYAD